MHSVLETLRLNFVHVYVDIYRLGLGIVLVSFGNGIQALNIIVRDYYINMISPAFRVVLTWLTFLSLLTLNDSFNATERTAVILTGQLRSANLTIVSDLIKDNAHKKMFGIDDPATSALTILEFFLKPLAEYGGVDVFMYVEAHPEDQVIRTFDNLL